MERSFTAASFQPPFVDPAGANSSRYPSWVLLDSIAYIADPDDATTLKATTSAGHEFKVTFCLADPPAISYFCVDYPGISIQEVCITEPRVVSSANDLVLLCFAFKTNPPSTDKNSHYLEYFVYKAAPGGKHTIKPVPRSPPAYRHSWHAAIVPREGDNFLVADLYLNGEDLGHYNLHIFSSETGEWSTKHVQLKESANVVPRDLPSQTDKVISLGVSTVGWVDLWRGILVCDLLQKDPVLCFLPLPKASYKVNRETKVWPVRDVTGSPDGLINFIEIEHCSKWAMFIHLRSFKTTAFLDFLDTICDSDIVEHHEMDSLKNEMKSVSDGWKIRTFSRSISWNYWRKGHTVHVDDISADPRHALQLPHLWDSRAQKCILRNLKTTPGFPAFSIDGGDIVYLMSKVDDKDAWMLSVDLGKKSLEVLKPYCASRATYLDEILGNTFISCAFSKYLNTTSSPRHGFCFALFSILFNFYAN
ncbi:hypothetical protein ACQJBY_023091 [Aegilops geniculata]